MKVTVARKALHEGLQLVTRVVSGHTSLPVLNNVLLEPHSGGLKLAGTNLELALEVQVPAAGEGDPFTVPAKTLAEIVGALPEADVELSAEKDTLIVTCRKSVYRITGLGAEDFPPLPEVRGAVKLTLPQATAKSILRRTVLAASDDETRPVLTGVYLSVSGGQLRAVATDTHRMAVHTAPVESDGETAVIVPAKAVAELGRVLVGDEPLTVLADQNQIMFRTERATIVSRLIEGQYPKWERVVPKKTLIKLSFVTDELTSALRRARIVARDAGAKDRVVLSTSGENVVVTAEGPSGSASEEVWSAREGDDISIAFNVAYLLDALSVMDCSEVALELTDPLAPAVMRPGGGDGYFMLLMPMQVQ